MTHRLWLERPLPPEFASLIQGRLEVIGSATETPDDKLAKIGQAHGIIAAARIQYNNDVFDLTPELKVIARTGVGYDNIDLDAATERGICVCNVPDGPTRSTAEQTIALMFAVCKELKPVEQKMQAGGVQDFFTISKSIELHRKTLGLVGYGRIGRCVAALAQGIGMNVQVYDPFVDPSQEADSAVSFVDDLAQMLGSSDVVSVHVPLSPKTRHLMNVDRLSQMKPGSFLINCSRGGTVDENALLDALVSGHLAGAGLDVWEQEPPAPGHPLFALPQVVGTPHVAAATDSCKARLWEGALTQIMDACEGKRPEYLINQDVWAKLSSTAS